MKEKIVSVDIDGVLRDLYSEMVRYLEVDHPDKVEKFKSSKEYSALDDAFGDREKAMEWLYSERVFQVFGMAPKMHKNVIDHLNILNNSSKGEKIKFVVSSVQRNKSIPATMHWLSKNGCTIEEYVFHSTQKEKSLWTIKNATWVLDDSPIILEDYIEKKGSDRVVKVEYDYNSEIDCKSLDAFNCGLDELYEIIGIQRKINIKE
jgi:5'(3')-deoxyribonucleotidase